MAAASCKRSQHSISDPQLPASAGALNTALPYGPAVVDHCILTAGLPPQQLVKQAALSPDQQQGLLTAVLGWEKWLDDCETQAPKGYITYRRAGGLADFATLVISSYRGLCTGASI